MVRLEVLVGDTVPLSRDLCPALLDLVVVVPRNPVAVALVLLPCLPGRAGEPAPRRLHTCEALRGQRATDDHESVIQEELGGRITGVQGTGLLFSVELDSSRYKSYGTGSIEEYMRHRGLNVIHGGENSLRFTPNFTISEDEVDLIVDITRDAILNGPVKASASEAEAA